MTAAQIDRPTDRAGRVVPLGIDAKSVEARRSGPSRKPEGRDRAASLKVRYDLLRTAQSVLFRANVEAKEQHRTCWCHRSITNRGETIGVYRHAEGTGARLSGVGTCGSVWTCPVCSGRVTEARRRELQAAMVEWVGRGGHAYLLTLTSPHREDDGLDELFTRQRKALQVFRGCATFRRVAKAYDRAGAVHSSEVTWGANGWHPHAHDLWFAQPGLELDAAAIRRLRGAWVRAQLKAGIIRTDGTLKPLRDAWKWGLDLRGGTGAAEYIAKYGREDAWGLSSEMTRPHAKVGLRKAAWLGSEHFTPFGILEWAQGGDGAARDLFREYARVYTGRRMLSWSRGLKALLNVADLTDEQLAASPLPAEERVGQITTDDYAVVTACKAVGELLEYAARWCIDPDNGQRDLDEFMQQLRARLRAADRPPGRPDLRAPHGSVRDYPHMMENAHA